MKHFNIVLLCVCEPRLLEATPVPPPLLGDIYSLKLKIHAIVEIM